jgi:hypothetical protein
MRHLKVLAFLGVMILLGGSCKHDPPVGPKTKCDTCITPCDTCHTDTTHHATSNDTTSHNFVWTQSSIPGEASLSGCWVFEPKNIYVVGGSVWKFDGIKWTDVSPIGDHGSYSGQLSGFSMFAFSPHDYWLTNGGLIFHSVNDHVVYHVFPNDSAGFLHSSWGTSSSDFYSVGDGGTILHFDGTAWTKMASGTTKNLYSIWGTGDNNIWAAGYNPHTAESALLQYNGTSWRVIDLSTLGKEFGAGAHGVDAVWAADTAGHHVTVVTGSLVWHKKDNDSWQNDSGKVSNELGTGGTVGLYLVSGNTPNDFMTTGGWGWLGHWNGKSWHQYTSLYDYSIGDFAPGGLSMKDNTVCAVGVKNGASWIAIGQR